VLKVDSEDTEVAGIVKKFFAIFATTGYLCAFSLHHINTSKFLFSKLSFASPRYLSSSFFVVSKEVSLKYEVNSLALEGREALVSMVVAEDAPAL
jgi:hypothetical protein